MGHELASETGGEAVEVAIPVGYEGASQLVLTADEASRLMEPFPDDDHDILPTGEVYVAQVQFRRRLNQILGPGQWALLPRGAWTEEGDGTLHRDFALFVRGRFVAEAPGEAALSDRNDRMSVASARESAKSNALVRCAKDLSVGWECWHSRWANDWRDRACLKVWVDGKDKPLWRRRDARPFYKEKGAATDRPTDGQRPVAAPAPRRPAPAAPAAPPKLTDEQRETLRVAAVAANLSRGALLDLVRDVTGTSDVTAIPADRFEPLLSALRTARATQAA